MDGIYYNQEVTGEVLNAMAIDLGNTSFNGFDGITKFGADKLNEITKALVSKGILTTDDMCRCEKTGNGITVHKGTIVFESGVKKTISEPVEIEAENGMAVYALNNTAAGVCTLEAEQDFPTDTGTDYVPLCKINANGTLTDKRSIAEAKVDFPTVIRTEIYAADGVLEVSDDTWNKHNYFLITNYINNDTVLREIKSIPFNERYWLEDNHYASFVKTDTGVKISFDSNYSGGKIFFI